MKFQKIRDLNSELLHKFESAHFSVYPFLCQQKGVIRVHCYVERSGGWEFKKNYAMRRFLEKKISNRLFEKLKVLF